MAKKVQKDEKRICAWCFKEHQAQKMVFLGHYNSGQGDYSGHYCLECVEEALQTIKKTVKGER